MSRISGIEEGNKELLEQLKKTSAIRQRHLELKEIKEENKILFRDLSSIPDHSSFICSSRTSENYAKEA